VEHTPAQPAPPADPSASPPPADPSGPPLPTALSWALVAFIIEFDNEFEHRMPHKTTRHGTTGGLAHPPWLVSMAMWAHCMRHVPPDGIAAGELARRSGLTAKSLQMVVKRMSQWWGYLSVTAGLADGGAKPPRSAWLVRPTRAGRQAQEVWEPLTGEIEDRWRDRFGQAETERLRAALHGVVSQSGTGLPDFLPVGQPRLGKPPADGAAATAPPATGLPGLLSQALLGLALDFEDESDLSLGQYTAAAPARLAVSASVLRVLDGPGVRVSDVPALTGVAKMAVDNWLGSLETHRYLAIGPDPAGSRFKVATLTARGERARDAYLRWAGEAERRWQDRFGVQTVDALRRAAQPFVNNDLLRQGTEPYPDGWRAAVRRPGTLPYYPVISARGGFPDGS
jgi:DNA-binding MarR family transcriptional regulator